MKKLAVSIIAALLAVVVPLAAFAGSSDRLDFQSTVLYKDGILYAYDYWRSDHITLHIPPGVKVYGQMVRSDLETAVFTPVTESGTYNLKSSGRDYSFSLMVAALSGTGDVVVDIGGRKEVIHVDSAVSGKPVIKLPDFRISYTLPYSLSATGNIVLNKKATEQLQDDYYRHRDIWGYRAADGGLLDGTMHLSYQMPEVTSGTVRGPAFGFPFCPASVQAWLDKVKKTPEPPPKPPKQPEQPTKPGHSSLPAASALGALLAGAAWLTRKKWLPLLPPFRAVYVSLSLQETAPGTVAVTYEPKRGPKQVTAQLRAGTGTLAEITLSKGETRQVELPPGFAGTVTVQVRKYRNLSREKSVTVDSAGPA
ncbi:hypothetical protein G7K71_02815 [Desulfofundulus sp. TPOSR]|uniref:hypothetical protein n=1 Tax=Desulfofundulus sp. TPOSR TaxID=2714340 RepID=UPI001409A894|nr:hypothetical protein [Desulfofundulus sp. TPOSR]NHM25958.1 hypothetical protein [Desulfofundulus sp. TPOSR]